MVRITFWLQLLLLVLKLRQSDALSDQCSELQNEISRLERHILKKNNGARAQERNSGKPT